MSENKFIELSEEQLLEAVSELEDIAISKSGVIVAHVMGGQRRAFFEKLSHVDGINLIARKSILPWYLALLSFIPSQEAFLKIRPGVDIKNNLINPVEGLSMIGIYVIIKDFVSELQWEEIQNLISDKTKRLASVVFDLKDNGKYLVSLEKE